MADITKDQLLQLAKTKLSDAKLLLASGSSGNAYYLSGYAVEFVLKAVLSSRFREGTLADPAWSQKVFTHNLQTLINLALLDQSLKAEQDASPEFAGRWQTVQQWNEISRYELREAGDAELLIEAIEHPDHGVLKWLKSKLS